MNPKNYYKRIIYNGLNLKTDYKYKPGFGIMAYLFALISEGMLAGWI